MNTVLQAVWDFLKREQWIAMLASALPVLVAVLLKWFSSRLVEQYESKSKPSVQFANERVEEIDYERDTRLSQARSVLKRQESSAKWNKWIGHSLTFGQYVVGGILATSFVQASLSKEAVGFLGVLVLVSSLIYQRFRPDLHYRATRERAVQLRLLIRKAEDDVYVIQQGKGTAKTVEDVWQMVSEGLTRIEQEELADINNTVQENETA
jgi:hypothetical protein